jgi:hypothetical protein
VIRFSAALVAVAIGVLVGGIATSKLVLVYIAIVVSAAALVTLAVGVVLKREELFGEGQGLAPAGAGASPALPARTGAGSWNQARPRPDAAPDAPVAPSAPQTGTAAAFGGPALASNVLASNVPASKMPSAGPVSPLADSEPTQWDAPATGGWWSTPAPASLAPFGRDKSPSAPAPGQSGTAPGPSDAAPGASDTVPGEAQATQADPVLPPPPPPPPAWSESAATPARPYWFDWPGESGGADESPVADETPASDPVPAPVPAPASVWSRTVPASTGGAIPDQAVTLPAAAAPATAPPATAPPAPPGTPATASGRAIPDDTVTSPASTQPASTLPATAPPAPSEPPATPPGGSIPDETVTLPVATPSTVTLPAATPSGDTVASAGGAASGADDDDDEDWPTRYSWLEDETDDDAATGTAVADADEAGHEDDAGEGAEDEAESGPEAEVFDFASARERAELETAEPETAELEPESEAGPGLAAVPDHDADDAGPPADAGAPAAGAGLVTVVRGVPRYHQPDCVLIRFMPDGDVQKLSVPEATAAGCTPCTACQA